MTIREQTSLLGLSAQLSTAVLIGLVLGAIGPFGTFDAMSAPTRYFYWSVLVLLNWLQVLIVRRFLNANPLTQHLPKALLGVLAGSLSAVPATFEVFWFESTFRGAAAGVPLPELFVYVWLLTLLIAIPASLIFGTAPPLQAVTSPPSPPTAHFLQRLPEDKRGQLVALEMQDHYLCVHTDHGQHLLLMRMSDALAELKDADGQQTHRSWWVARAAVKGLSKRGTTPVLRLKNGLNAPVSRSHFARLRHSGWL